MKGIPNSKLPFDFVVMFLVAIVVTSCHKDYVYMRKENHPPVADAGPDQTVMLDLSYGAVLNGDGSSDPDNNIVTYEWTKLFGPSFVKFSIPVSEKKWQVLAANLVEGVYLFELKVTDAGGLFSRDTMQVDVFTTSSGTRSCDNSGRRQVNAQLITFGNLSEARYRVAVASAGNKILFGGGYLSNGVSSRVDIYDRVAQTWSTAELSVARGAISAIAAGSKIFFAGGQTLSGVNTAIFSAVDIYDASTDTWSTASLSEPRSLMAAAAVGNKVFFAGGVNGYSGSVETYSDKVDIYDVLSNSWSTSRLSKAKADISAVTVQNKVYIAGGYELTQVGPYVSASPSRTIDIFDNAANSWSLSHLYEPKADFAALAIGDNIYWAGGISSWSSPGSCTVEIKNVKTWSSSIASLYHPAIWGIDGGENAVVSDNKIVFPSDYDNRFDIYDIANNSWFIGLLPVTRLKGSIISVNNSIYITGAYVDGTVSNKVWKLEF